MHLLKNSNVFLNPTLMDYNLIVQEAHKLWCQAYTEASNRKRHYKFFVSSVSNALLERTSWGIKVARFGETENCHSSPLASENG